MRRRAPFGVYLATGCTLGVLGVIGFVFGFLPSSAVVQLLAFCTTFLLFLYLTHMIELKRSRGHQVSPSPEEPEKPTA
ncbi:hypothetical protein KGD82_26865 [Nocardiopsis eucommiae]|uniref:Uncharacterized protein n=1 Tax=Nocardiopsis eucommiae TaxID=2831970 RepID=A0A975QKP5_9ACTN|nr:hypothetical protein KGD82_26865 [Nocardiopsis eucommiae]